LSVIASNSSTDQGDRGLRLLGAAGFKHFEPFFSVDNEVPQNGDHARFSGDPQCGSEPPKKVGEITMDNELLYAKIEALEGKRPLARRRPRR
jgi:hypothetical protein